MPAQTESRAPKGLEALFYVGAGGFFALVVVVTVGLSIYGYQASADSRAERTAGADVAREEALEEAGLDAGATVFANRCASCHGSNGDGGFGPSFVGITERMPDVADHEAVVRAGRGQMPSFDTQLSDAEIEMVVRYEREVLDAS